MERLLEGSLWFVMVAIAIIVVLVFVTMARFRRIIDTNDKVEENQRRGIELAELQDIRQRRLEEHTERQTAALERIADALESR